MITHLLWILLLATVFVVPVLLAALRARRRRRAQDALLAECDDGFRSLQTVRVRLARPEFRATRIATAEGWGWLGFDAHRVRVIGRLDDGTVIERDMLREQSSPLWLGDTVTGAHGLHWFAIGEPRLHLSADGLSDWNSAAASAALYTQLAPGDAARPPRSKFHLQSHPLSLGFVVLCAALWIYAVLDGVLSPYTLVGDHGWVNAAALACIPASLLLYPLLLSTRLPRKEALLLPLVLGVSVCLAAIPAIMRVDRMTGSGDFDETLYFLDTGTTFKPIVSGPPRLRFHNSDEYWSQLHPGEEQGFYLRRGGLGLWQVHAGSVRQDMRLWYSSNGKPVPRILDVD
ncbi:hypothetical protein [Tahibacter sp.]|uniref:hypothetical protein n=1 Tax=Tahibacter sp. TaxID=2056211 RepID=UPI0028C47889|nr:hypothetical protein [Tahibacter sp.]